MLRRVGSTSKEESECVWVAYNGTETVEFASQTGTNVADGSIG